MISRTLARVNRVLDGDTLEVIAYVWPDIKIQTIIRLKHIDTPEKRSKDPYEREMAQKAWKFLQKLCPLDSYVELAHVEHGKYANRMLADVWCGEHGGPPLNVANQMIINKHARPYEGGKRKKWTLAP